MLRSLSTMPGGCELAGMSHVCSSHMSRLTSHTPPPPTLLNNKRSVAGIAKQVYAVRGLLMGPIEVAVSDWCS